MYTVEDKQNNSPHTTIMPDTTIATLNEYVQFYTADIAFIVDCSVIVLYDSIAKRPIAIDIANMVNAYEAVCFSLDVGECQLGTITLDEALNLVSINDDAVIINQCKELVTQMAYETVKADVVRIDAITSISEWEEITHFYPG